MAEKTRKHFRIKVTRYDGQHLSLRCRLGGRLEMQDHWLGTYLFIGGGMILVTESRAQINERILDGLRTNQ